MYGLSAVPKNTGSGSQLLMRIEASQSAGARTGLMMTFSELVDGGRRASQPDRSVGKVCRYHCATSGAAANDGAFDSAAPMTAAQRST